MLLPGGSGYFTCIQNMKLVTNKFNPGGLHEKHVVATVGDDNAYAYTGIDESRYSFILVQLFIYFRFAEIYFFCLCKPLKSFGKSIYHLLPFKQNSSSALIFVCKQSMAFRLTTDVTLYDIKRPIFIMKVKYIYCEVETENLKIIHSNFLLESFKRRRYVCQIPFKKCLAVN